MRMYMVVYMFTVNFKHLLRPLDLRHAGPEARVGCYLDLPASPQPDAVPSLLYIFPFLATSRRALQRFRARAHACTIRIILPRKAPLELAAHMRTQQVAIAVVCERLCEQLTG